MVYFSGNKASLDTTPTPRFLTQRSLRFFDLICLPSGPCNSHATTNNMHMHAKQSDFPRFGSNLVPAFRMHLQPYTPVASEGVVQQIVDHSQEARNCYNLTSPHPIASSLIILTVIAFSHALAHLALPTIKAREPCRVLIAMPCHDVTTIASHASPSRRPCSALLYGGGIPPRFSNSF
jgi:hypothetical protein